MDTEVEPTFTIDKNMYINIMDEDFGLLCVSMSPEILFHIEAFTTPDEIWKKLEDIFGKHDEMRGHMLEVELNSLDPRNFDNIRDFFMKFKSLLLHLKGRGKEKSTQCSQLILSILEKLGWDYVVSVSSFHTNRFTSGEAWKMPTMDHFIESLMHEKDKLIKMGIIKGPNVHALAVHERNNTSSSNSKKKGKGKVHADPKKEGYSTPFDDSSGSKGSKGKKGKNNCGYCNHGYHPESTCMKKQID
jgi:hypothetical protein